MWEKTWHFYVVFFLVASIEKAESWIRKRNGWPELTRRQVIARGVVSYLAVAIWIGYRRGEFADGASALLELVWALGVLALAFGAFWAIFNIPLNYGRKGDHRQYHP